MFCAELLGFAFIRWFVHLLVHQCHRPGVVLVRMTLSRFPLGATGFHQGKSGVDYTALLDVSEDLPQ